MEPAEDTHFDDGVFTLSGTAEPDSHVRIFDGDARVMGSAVTDQDGTWSVDLVDVSEGRHVYAATATDASRNESDRSAERTVAVDLTAPDTLIESSPASATDNTVATFQFRSDEPGAAFECSMNGDPFERCSSPLEYGGLSDGEYVFDVRAIDRAGNVDPSAAQRSFVVDIEAPEARLTSPAEDALVRDEVELAAEASDDRAVKRVEFLVDGKLVDSDLQGPYDFGWDSGLVDDGAHTVEVRVTDEAGNRTTSAARGIRVDNTAPDTHITESPALITNLKGARFAFSSEDAGARFEFRMGDAPFESCTSPKEYQNLSDGSHTFWVRAVDEAGNTDDSPAERRVEVDTAAPAVKIDSAPSGTVRDKTARVAFSSEAGAKFACSLDGEDFGACSSPVALEGLSDGSHTFRVRATDAAGNTGPVAESSWTVDTRSVDTTAPTVVKTSPTGKKATYKSVAAATLSEKMNAATINTKTFRLIKKGTKKPVAATVRYDSASNKAILKPKRKLVRGASYTATMTTGVKDLAGNPLAANKVWRFKVK